MFDVQFAPHPCEIVGGHGIVAVHGVTRAVLQMLEPRDEVFAAPEGCAPPRAATHCPTWAWVRPARRDSVGPALRVRAFSGLLGESLRWFRPVCDGGRLSTAPQSGFPSAASRPDRRARRRA